MAVLSSKGWFGREKIIFHEKNLKQKKILFINKFIIINLFCQNKSRNVSVNSLIEKYLCQPKFLFAFNQIWMHSHWCELSHSKILARVWMWIHRITRFTWTCGECKTIIWYNNTIIRKFILLKTNFFPYHEYIPYQTLLL